MYKTVPFLFLIIVAISACQEPSSSSKRQLLNQSGDSLTTKLQKIYEQGFINGFSVAVVDKSGLLYQNGFGYANKSSQISFTENTLINIGSVTKTVVGLSLLKAQELGLLSLDDSISAHLSFTVENPYFPDEPITIRQLANHTSTIIDTDYFERTCYVMLAKPDTAEAFPITIPSILNNPEDTTSLANFMESMLKKEGSAYSKEAFLEAKPGEKFQYSNTGAGLAALIIENVSGLSFAEFSKRNVLEPLAMKSSAWKRGGLDPDKFSKNYASIDTVYPDYHLINYPDGGLLSSASDLGKLLTELIKGYDGEGTILSSESYHTLYAKDAAKELFTDVEAAGLPELNARLDKGIFMALGSENTVGHTGADPGVVSFMFFNAETGTGRVLLINTTIDDPNQGAFTEFFEVWDALDDYAAKLKKADNKVLIE